MLYLACIDINVFFFTLSDRRRHKLWSCQNECDTLSYLLDNNYIRFVTNLCINGIPMGTNCAPLIAELIFILLRSLFLFLIIIKL